MLRPELRAEAPTLTEVLALSDEALVAFVDFIRLNSPQFTRDPAIIRRVFAAYVEADDFALSPAEATEGPPMPSISRERAQEILAGPSPSPLRIPGQAEGGEGA